jgi:hypothetical protein
MRVALPCPHVQLIVRGQARAVRCGHKVEVLTTKHGRMLVVRMPLLGDDHVLRRPELELSVSWFEDEDLWLGHV